jgi:RCC1 and BTB domain-containing protein
MQVACGAHHTLALLDNGWVYGWGWNSQGQLGFATQGNVCVTSPKRVDVLSVAVTELSCGNTHSAALTGNIKV